MPTTNAKPGKPGICFAWTFPNLRNTAWRKCCTYRLKPEERQAFWGKSVGKTIEVGISKIRHGDNGGKATLIGKIITAK